MTHRFDDGGGGDVVEVAGRRGDTGVAQLAGDDGDVDALGAELSGVRVAQAVGVDALVDARPGKFEVVSGCMGEAGVEGWALTNPLRTLALESLGSALSTPALIVNPRVGGFRNDPSTRGNRTVLERQEGGNRDFEGRLTRYFESD